MSGRRGEMTLGQQIAVGALLFLGLLAALIWARFDFTTKRRDDNE